MNLQYKSKKSILIVILIFIPLLLVVFFLFKQIDSPPPQEVDDTPTADALLSELEPAEDDERIANEVEILFVDLKGAVQKTGVYEMESGLRVKDVIEKAGGFTKAADVNSVNLAALLEDEMVIYVPLKGEEVDTYANETVVGNSDGKKVNINSATSEELQTLTGIGPSKATTIISYREEHGKFNSVEDLLEVSGIGEKTLEKIKENLTVK